MGKAIGKIAIIAVAVFAPYAAAALGLSGFAATAFSFGLQMAANMIFADKPKEGGGAGVKDSGFMVNKNGNVQPIPIIYGTRRIGGTRVYVQTTNSSGATSGTEFLHLVVAVAQGGTRSDGTDAINKINRVYFGADEVYNFDTSSFTSPYSVANTTLRCWHGKNDQTVASPDQSVGTFTISSEWTSNHRMRGVSYVYAICKYDRDTFPGAPNIFVEIDGKRIQAVNSLGSFVNTSAEMTNPANILYDYLTDTRYGKAIAASDIDLTSFQTARTWANSAGIDFNCALDTADTIFNNTQKILSCANMNLCYTDGKYQVKPVKQESFTGAFTFTTANIIGQWTISLGNKRNRFNKLIVNYFNPDLDWQPDSLVVESSTFLTEDNNQENLKEIDLPLIGNKTLATKIGTYYLNQSRHQKIVSFTATHEAIKLQVGDPILITHDVPGWTNEKYRVNSIILNADTTVQVVAEAYAPDSIYLENT